MRILIVEDEEKIRKLMKFNLEMEGYEAVACPDGKSALNLIDGQHFDLLVLDIMLPELSGLQICETIRLRNKDIPIIFVSAKDSNQDRIQGLRIGADDYLTKPFSLEEFLLRIHNLLKRQRTMQSVQADNLYTFGANTINFDSFEANTANGKMVLTQKEILLLKMLIERKNEVISRQQILQNVWGYDIFPSTRTIDNFILAFRKYFEEDPRNPKHFHSIRGVGYKFMG